MKIADLMKSKKCTIGYIGGSVTEGREYSDLFTAYLKEIYPENTIIIQFDTTATPLEEAFFSKKINPPSHEVHMTVAKHYNIPYINAGKIIHENIVKNNDDINTVLFLG